MERELVVLSPEKSILTYRLAGLGSRAGAHFLDAVIVIGSLIAFAVLLSVGSGLLGTWLGTTPIVMSMTLILILTTFYPLAYFILLEGLWNGQTIGKKAVGLRVRMADGTPVTFGAAMGRNLLRPADMLPGTYFAGAIAVFATPRAQRLGDLIANTVVVYETRGLPMFTPSPHQVGLHPFEDRVGELRGMTMEEYVALRRYCDRFPELPAGIQHRLTEEIWQPIAERRGVQPIPNVHPIYLAEAVVMKYGRQKGML